MSENPSIDLYAGLQALAESSFPKKCNSCGRLFETMEQFIEETEHIRPSTSGLKQTTDDDGSPIVELFRNCPCGSTLMDACGDRRDLTKKGEQRRERFEQVLNLLINKHKLEPELARTELLKVVRGDGSDILAKIMPSAKQQK